MSAVVRRLATRIRTWLLVRRIERLRRSVLAEGLASSKAVHR